MKRRRLMQMLSATRRATGRMVPIFALMLALFALGWFAAALIGARTAHAAEPLELKRVLLSSGGVGYFEYEAQISGDAEFALEVPLDQVDDVLKSIVVFDSAGRVGAVTLPGRDALGNIFADLPVEPGSFDSTAGLLHALRGNEIAVTGGRTLTGRLAAVDTIAGEHGVTGHRISVLTANGLQSADLANAEAIRFADPKVQAALERGLMALAENGAQNRRTLNIESIGQGERTVRVGYVVEVPLWKAAYRLALGADDGTGRLQGWAVLENLSGQDWSDVELTLVSGNPVTFRQALYQAYYVDRPDVPVEVFGRILPRTDDGTLGMMAEADEEMRLQDGLMRQKRSEPSQAMAAPPPGKPEFAGGGRGVAAVADGLATNVSFTFKQAVTVLSGRSLTVPLVDRDVPVKRLAWWPLYNAGANPLGAVALSNDTGTALPAGVMTLYGNNENGTIYLGDARLGPLPAGEERLVAFAADLQMRVTRETETVQSIGTGKIADGVFTYERVLRQTTTYRIGADKEVRRQLVIDHPREPGMRLVTPEPETAELIDNGWRLAFELAGDGAGAIKVVTEQPVEQRVGLADWRNYDPAAFADARSLPGKVRDAFTKIAEFRARITEAEADLASYEAQRSDIEREQQRITSNMRQVPNGTDLHKRYIEQLETQEDRMAGLLEQVEGARSAREAAEAELRDYVRRLDI